MKKRHEQPVYSENWLGDHLAAYLLADTIRDFWIERQFYAVKVWVEERTRCGADGLPRTDYDIRSNLVGGKPPSDGLALAA